MTIFVQGDDTLLRKLYDETITRKKRLRQSKMGGHVALDILPSQKDVELMEMVDMIVRKNLPVGITEDPDFRYVVCVSKMMNKMCTNSCRAISHYVQVCIQAFERVFQEDDYESSV